MKYTSDEIMPTASVNLAPLENADGLHEIADGHDEVPSKILTFQPSYQNKTKIVRMPDLVIYHYCLLGVFICRGQ